MFEGAVAEFRVRKATITSHVMAKTTRSSRADSEALHFCADQSNQAKCRSGRVWRRGDGYWESLLRFKTILEREARMVAASKKTDSESAQVDNHISEGRAPYDRGTQPASCAQCRQRVGCFLTKN
jgi:hypothetical protein